MATSINVILARDVVNLGRIGDVVRAKPGYARNFLFPRGFAMPVSPDRMKQFDHQKQVIEHKRAKLRAQSEETKNTLKGVQVTITAKAGQAGKLFGSIGTRDIEAALKASGYAIHHRDIKIENPLKTIGLHPVEVRLEGDIKAMVNVVVVPEVEVAAESEAEEDAAEDVDPMEMEAEDTEA